MKFPSAVLSKRGPLGLLASSSHLEDKASLDVFGTWGCGVAWAALRWRAVSEFPQKR